MKTYYKKSEPCEAVQYLGTAESASEIIDWVILNGGSASYHCDSSDDCENEIHTLRVMIAPGYIANFGAGDWIVKDVRNYFYGFRDDHFKSIVLPGWSETGETHTEDTLMKVGEALRSTGAISIADIPDAIASMQNAGILFRERV